ncbi:hypothetical protein Rsub_02676 [Raphidocelis subcapitata]|uniref:Amino acid transporter transmembrane domain-containing protein n=1 Tax=Raphidocelis subcapitata TaxID=307507 RepID=A0A2V0NWM4_9CHLO|nr:hypothetical protein Rsub_02676 [Raphidocelis subcapitata]|eukprot:GBF89970.1 hypothetical protein Rsub_02676 [Raphidocelis subcapitata]
MTAGGARTEATAGTAGAGNGSAAARPNGPAAPAPGGPAPAAAAPRRSLDLLGSDDADSNGAEAAAGDEGALWERFHGRRQQQSRQLLRSVSTLGRPHKGHSSWLAGVGHLICATIGAGVLSLPNAVAWLGYVAGPLMIVFCTGVAMASGEMLTPAYRAKGHRRPTFKDAVSAQLGRRHAAAIISFLYLKYFLITVGYTVVTATAMQYIARYACDAAGKGASCPASALWIHVLIFSAVQLLLSQLPNLESVAGASAVGALMSLLYTGIAAALAFALVGRGRGSPLGRPGASPFDKTMGVFNALGSILFLNGTPMLTIDIQHTMKEPPPSEITMRKVVRTAFSVSMLLYLAAGTAGYIAIGDGVGTDILVEFENEPQIPEVVPLIANVAIIVHFFPAYQVFAQPLFVVLEQALLRMLPARMRERLAIGSFDWSVRLVYRSLYVCITAVLAACLPFFGAISGLIGALAFWPTVVLAPIMMYLQIRKPPKAHVLALQALLWAMLAVSACALVGSFYSFVQSARNFKPFGGGAHRPH